MAPRGFKLAGRGKRQIKGSIGGGGKKGNLSRKAPAGATVVSSPTGTTPTPTPTPVVNPLFPFGPGPSTTWGAGKTKIVGLPKEVTNALDPRLQGVSGDSLRERMDTYNRQRLAPIAGQLADLKRQQTANRAKATQSSMNAFRAGERSSAAPSTSVRRTAPTPVSRSSATTARAATSSRAAAAPARAASGASRAAAAPAAARAAAPAPARPVTSTSVRRTAPTPPAKKATTRVVTRGR